jgi:hypothetical protein
MPGLWLLISLATAALLILGATSAAFATLPGSRFNQKLPISAAAARYQGADETCEGTPSGSAIWHFVLTKTSASSATLELTFSGVGSTQYPSVVRTGGTLHWYVTTTSPVTLTAASTDARGNRLNLSEICDGGLAIQPTEQPSATYDLATGDPATADPTFDLATEMP